MNDVSEADVKYTWELISEFVCWEFCRNTNFKGVICDADKQTDLLQFFRDMVIKKTTKKYESDITSQEIAAKFIEELNVLVTSPKPQEKFDSVTKLSEALKKLCPQLKAAVTELLSALYLKLYVMKESGARSLSNDVQLWKKVKAFYVEVNKHLPVPDLIKATHSLKKPNTPAFKEAILDRLKKEKITKQEMLKIKKSIDNDILLRMYYDEVSYVPPEYESPTTTEVEHTSNAPVASVVHTETGQRSKSTVQHPVTNRAAFVDLYSSDSESSEYDMPLLSRVNKRITRRVSEDTDEDEDSDGGIEIVKEVWYEDPNSICKNAVVRLKKIKIEDVSDEESGRKESDVNSKKSHSKRSCYQPIPVNAIKKECTDGFTTGKKASRVRNNSKTKKKKKGSH